jgi:hypothetical protein
LNVSSGRVGSYWKVLICVEVGRVLVESYIDNFIGDGFVDDILKTFPVAARLVIQGLEGRQVCLDVPFVF